MQKAKITTSLLTLAVLIFVGCSGEFKPQKYSWETAYAKVLETGDLECEELVFRTANFIMLIKQSG